MPCSFLPPLWCRSFRIARCSERRSNAFISALLRSNNDGFEFNSSLNIIQWISMLQDIYEKFDYNDLECQKRLICEVMREPDYYGAAAQKFKAGFQ